MACLGGQLELVNALLGKGSDPHHVNVHNTNPLMSACANGHKDVCQVLLDAGVDVMTKEYSRGWVALHWAAANDHLEVCLMLLSKNADLFALDDDDETALDVYGDELDGNDLTHPRPELSEAIKVERRKALSEFKIESE